MRLSEKRMLHMNNAIFYDELHITDLIVFAGHGVFPEETKLGQKFVLDMILYIDTYEPALTDDLNKSVNYGQVCHFTTEFFQKNTYKLIETAAEMTANAILKEFPLLKGITLEVKKPWAPIGLPVEYASCRITRMRHTAFIALGSNMGDSKGFLDMAVKELDDNEFCKVKRVSEYIITKPYGEVEQDDFVNGALMLETTLAPEALLDLLHSIENMAGRKREIRWGPRTLDLDILLYDDLVMETENLIIPHYDMTNRDFVLIPMAEIAPWKRHPIAGKTMEELKKTMEDHGRT